MIKMRIDLNEIDGVLNSLEKMGEEDRGFQPQAALSCFRKFNAGDDENCEKCGSYETCKSYLGAFETKR
jgi:hypothetical protein